MKKSKIMKILVVVVSIFVITGCTTTLKDPKTKKVVTYEDEKVKITLNENILCKPTNEGLVKEYNKYKKQIDISKLPDCDKFKPSDENYNNLWETLVVKPLAWLTLKIGNLVKSYGIALIILSIIIRLILAPFTKKTAMQSENMKKMQPEIDRINKKYENKTDQDSMTKKSMETMALYKKYDINPFSSCLFAFLQLPIFFAFLEAVYRVPAFFEKNFLVFNLGTTPLEGIKAGNYWYIILVVLIILATVFSFKNMNMSTNKEQAKQMKMMTTFMIVFISFVSFGLPTSIALYWIVSNGFTVVQNLLLKKGK